MKVGVLLICLIFQIQNGRVTKVEPQEIRREHPVTIATCLIRAELILVGRREPALADFVRRMVVDGPGDDGLELLVRLISTATAVIPGLTGGEVVVRFRGRVIADDTCPYVEWGARIVEDATAGEGLVEAVASRCRVCPNPVVPGLLVRLDNDHVALAHADAQGGRLIWRYWHQVILDDGHGMVVNGENKMCASRSVD